MCHTVDLFSLVALYSLLQVGDGLFTETFHLPFVDGLRIGDCQVDKPVDWLFPRGERKIMFIDLLTFIKLLIEKIRYTFCLLDLIVTRYGEVDKAAFVQIRI